jgi:phage terminase large subunit-like protein
MQQRQRPSLKMFHEHEPWKAKDYKKRYNQAIKDGLFMLGMVNPLTEKRMYDATAIDNINDYYFCFNTSDMVLGFISDCLTHTKPHRFAKFPLHESQVRFFCNLFGWKKKSDGYRRFRECMKYVPRKNSKSWDEAAVCHIGMILDGEDGVEIYNIASDKNQAKKVFEPFIGSIKNDEERPDLSAGGFLADYYNIIGKSEVKAVTANNELDVCKPIANDENAAHGGNAHMAVLDEIHAMSDGGMFEVMQTSMSVRDQPLIVSITTADFARESFCNNKLDYSKRVCKDPNFDVTFLPVLYYADPDEFQDDWKDPEVWLRVNPLLNVAKKIDYMKQMYQKACNDTTFTNTFKRLDLNIMTMSENAAFNVDKWHKCGVKPVADWMLCGQPVPLALDGAECFVGIDNAYKNDLNAMVLDFPATDDVLAWCWVPRKHPDIVKLRADYGDYLLTAGDDEIDFEEIYQHIQEIFKAFNVREVGFDPNKSMEIRNFFKKDYPDEFYCTIAQNVTNLSEPLKKIIGDVNNMNIRHTCNPLLTWQISNTDIKESSNNDFMIVKPKGADSKRKKVDASVAWVMARCLRLKAEEMSNPLDWVT